MLPNYRAPQERLPYQLFYCLIQILFHINPSVIGTYVILRSRYDKEFVRVTQYIQDDLEHERLLLIATDNNLAKKKR